MKQIGEASDGAGWNAELIGQLAFIRKHKRFPVNRRTLTPLLTIVVACLGLPIWILLMMVRHQDSGRPAHYWLLLLIWLPVLVGLFRYFRSLHFVSVPAYPLLADNMELVERFLQSNHFAFSRHPEAPEVFQMVSRNLGRGGELREVLFFIADNGCVLLNSHFSGKTFGMPVSSGHSRNMARELKKFLQTYRPEKSSSLRRTY